MAIQLQGNGGTIADVQGSTFRALKVVNMPSDYGSFGYYQASMTSGILPAALAAGSASAGHVFAFRWGDATRLCILQSLIAKFQQVTVFTASTLTDLGFDAVVNRSYSASHSGGTAATLTGNSFKTRTSMGTTLLTDMRISTTTALTASGGTYDAQAFAQMQFARLPESAITVPDAMVWKPDVSAGEAPLVFAQNEGFIIRNRNIWPAAGTGVITISLRWAELAAY